MREIMKKVLFAFFILAFLLLNNKSFAQITIVPANVLSTSMHFDKSEGNSWNFYQDDLGDILFEVPKDGELIPVGSTLYACCVDATLNRVVYGYGDIVQILAYNNKDAAYLKQYGLQPGEITFNSPQGVVMDNSTIYISDTNNNRIVKLTYDSSGDILSSDTYGGFNHPAKLAMGTDGSVWVADKGNNRVVKMSSTGNVSDPIGAGSGSGDWQFSSPEAVAVLSSDEIIIADTGNDRIVYVNLATSTWITTDFSSGAHLTDVAVDGSEIYVADDGLDYIHKLKAPCDYIASDAEYNPTCLTSGANVGVNNASSNWSINEKVKKYDIVNLQADSPTTTECNYSYTLIKTTNVTEHIKNAGGAVVKVLKDDVSTEFGANISGTWDLTDAGGSPVPAGTYTLEVSASGVTRSVDVQVFGDEPYITAAPTALTFSATQNESNPPSQSITVTNSGGGTLAWTANENPNVSWLSLSNTSGGDGDAVNVSVDITGLDAGTYSTDIDMTDPAALNSPVQVAVTLNVTAPAGESVLAELEAEDGSGLPNAGWNIVTNDGSSCLEAEISDISSPPEDYRVDYTFSVPAGVSTVYVFAEVDVNGSGSDDSFWIKMNSSQQCNWNGLSSLGDGWNREWVFDYGSGNQYAFSVSEGTNTLSLYPRESGGFVNWLVVTTDGSLDIDNYTFSEDPPPPTDPVISVSSNQLNFTAAEGNNPSPQTLTITNSGGGALSWTADKVIGESWLTISPTSGTAGTVMDVTVTSSSFTAGMYHDTIRISDANASNSPVDVAVNLTITEDNPPAGELPADFEAELSSALPQSGWSETSNDGAPCLLATESDINGPNENYRLDYYFNVPSGVNTVYVFAEVDVNGSNGDDSFWITMNDGQQCNWNNLYTLGDGWQRKWVYDLGNGNQNQFSVSEGQNKLSLYPREAGAFINWLVVTLDGNTDINNYTFNGGSPPAAGPCLAVSPASLSFSAEECGSQPGIQSLTVSNCGDSTLSWNAISLANQNWLEFSPVSGTAGTQITVNVTIVTLTSGTYRDTIRVTDPNASNSPQDIPVTLTITTPQGSGSTLAEIEAESETSPPSEWRVTTNNNAQCLEALTSYVTAPEETQRIDYDFSVPADVSQVYVFAEVDANANNGDDSFWIKMNGGNQCNWNGLYSLGDGWNREWVYDGNSTGGQYQFPVNPGTTNTLSLYPRESGAFINWLVVTTDPDLDIDNYNFNGAPPSGDPVIAVNPATVSFSAVDGGTNPADQYITVTNSGGGTLAWSASEQTNRYWLTLADTTGGSGDKVKLSVDIAGLSTDSTYHAVVFIADANATNSPVNVNVALTITDSTAVHITVTAPNGGENWAVGSTQQIQWTSGGFSGNVNIDYSANNGSVWNGVAANVSNTGNYNWQIPDNVSENCLVKIAAVSDTTIYDISDAVFSIESPPVADDVWRVNCGGSQYTDGNSNSWSADQAYSSGSWGHNDSYTHIYTTTHTIDNTTDDALYQCMRYGMSYYNFDLPNGTYQVTLHFAELIQGTTRIFDVRIEGNLVLNDFNPYQEAGNQEYAAVTRSFQVDVTDGQLNINFYQVDGDPMISAIEVLGQGAIQQNRQIAAEHGDIVEIKSKGISQNYPNPFNPETAIRFQIDEPGTVSLTIYNVLGEKIRTLVNMQLNTGQYTYTWNGRDDAGSKVSSGVYFYTLRIGTFTETKRMILMQ